MTRLGTPYGSRLDRTRPVRFTFEGKAYHGFAGDCIASALAASDQWVLSRSFKYHRPRGIMTMAGAEANTLVQLPSEPNVPADLTPLQDGMMVTAQNVNGSLENDRDAVIDRFGRFLP
ncbi:MAG: aminomethyltransferase, partial [Mesorhizobium sp.]